MNEELPNETPAEQNVDEKAQQQPDESSEPVTYTLEDGRTLQGKVITDPEKASALRMGGRIHFGRVYKLFDSYMVHLDGKPDAQLIEFPGLPTAHEDLREFRASFYSPKTREEEIAEAEAEEEEAEKLCEASSHAFQEIATAFHLLIRNREYIPAEYNQRIRDLLHDWHNQTNWLNDAEEVHNYFADIADAYYWRERMKAEAKGDISHIY